ncbi:MAG: hypothetical protein U5L96_05160 [Owenweeksia sp.]|nr:hypothetical protein [Owenweeksia sp.]
MYPDCFTSGPRAAHAQDISPDSIRAIYQKAFDLSINNERINARTLIEKGLALSKKMKDSSLVASGYFHDAETLFTMADINQAEQVSTERQDLV